VVHTAGLTKTFRDFWLRAKVTAVADLNLDVLPKEVFGLLGPNGSGKSTTLKMILGLLYPTRGIISIFGKEPTNVQVKSRIGFLPEESHLYPFLDARETLEFYGRLFHQPRRQRQRRIDMLLDMVGLQAAQYRRVGEYSKGMRRRIGLAQALINDPDLLILDEPTSGLDPIGTRQFKDLIRMLADRGKTVILSSHLLADVEDVCDRVSILYGGRERAAGPIEELLQRQDQTQLLAESLDESTIAALNQVLTQAGKQPLDVSYPRARLEDLFLEIVEDARRRNITTGGAQAGGQVARFLVEDEVTEGEDLIESLVGKTEPVAPPPPADSHNAPAEPVVQRDVVEGLVAAEPPEPPREEDRPDARDAASKTAASDPGRQTDRSVLDSLMQSEQDEENDTA
jgi:ABC-2 type transport system ATP-binding protein